MFDDNVFHAHLEHCERCRFRPSDLCALGGQLLELQVRRGNKSLSLKMGIRNDFDENRDPLMLLHKQVGAKELIVTHRLLNPRLYPGDLISQIAQSPEEEKMMRSMGDIPGPIGEMFRAFTML